MQPIENFLRQEIERSGPIRFRQFMETALYHPQFGYYRTPRDPFGASGDFYTAEQVQPVFGRLIYSYFRGILEGLNDRAAIVVELGAGRREMQPFLEPLGYLPVDLQGQSFPETFSGILFANEFFDALPVDVLRREGNELRVLRVTYEDGFRWITAEAAPPELTALAPPREEGTTIEVCVDAIAWIDRISSAMRRGWAVIIDYGYTEREAVRFPEGTLMSYHRHSAHEDVLRDPGMRDITAHANFTVLTKAAQNKGFKVMAYDTLATLLLAIGKPDSFASALHAASAEETARLQLQLKTLLFGMGETFRVLVLRKEEA